MRYQKDIIERLSQGLAGVDQNLSAQFSNAFSASRPDLKTFCNEVNEHYANLLSPASSSKVIQIGVPERESAIPFWIDDLEAAALPTLRKARTVQ
ncbi:hypothetical protein STRATTON_240 [Erwinia phage vB_EamM_Stratton]|uniref:Uncharacterized protein n=1 Tax=Erwinia phage vB_EamM_Stratton TaxID=1883378 RepID=A0A1B2IHG3_9CAUD|nr:hypothetical protein STRATTON_240 [Erwinia phage vB_EamM_Stratton]